MKPCIDRLKKKIALHFIYTHPPGDSFGRGVFIRSLGSNSIIAGREYGDGRDVGVCMSGSSNLAEYSTGVFGGAGTNITDASDEDCCETESATSDYAGDLVLFEP